MDNSGPAFPNWDGHMGGLTKREWFAGMALQGFISAPNVILKNDDDFESMVLFCYKCADAMLSESKKCEQ